MVFNNNNKELVELTIHTTVQLFVSATNVILRLGVEVFYTYFPFSHLRQISTRIKFSRTFLGEINIVSTCVQQGKRLLFVHFGTTVLIHVKTSAILYALLLLYYQYKGLHFQILSQYC